LETVAVTTRGRRTVLSTDTREKRGLSVSPDGETIAFIASVGEHGQVILVPRDGGGTTKALPMAEGRPLKLAWSPHGDRLAYTVATTAGVQLWIVELATGTQGQVSTSGLSERGDVAWTARDEILFYTAGNRNYGVLAPGKPERTLVADDTIGWMSSIQPSPDGRRAAVAGTRMPEGRGVWAISLDDGAVTQIPSNQRTKPVGWSDDGAWVFVVNPISEYYSGSVLAMDASGTGSSHVVLDRVPLNSELRMLPGEEGFVAIEISWRSDLWLASLDHRRIDVPSAPLPPTAAPVVPPTPRSGP
jgi:Tol biopolymer transport system component